MNKKLICLIVLLMVAGALAFSLKPLGIISRSEKEFVFEQGTEVTGFTDADFYVEVKNDLGDPYWISVNFAGIGNKYFATAYLPGNVEPLDCALSWYSDHDVKISKHLKNYASGEFGLASDGYNMSFIVKDDGKSYDFLLKVMKGSWNVQPLLLSIDESEGTIADMNGDEIHETSCFGTVHFDNQDHFMSIKGRGNSTWTYADKRPYNITYLKEAYEGKSKVSMIEGVEAKKWSILANFADPSLLRNKIGYDLANTMGIGLPSQYYDVWMNGSYLGNYLVTPKNDYQATDEGFILELDNYVDEEDPQFYLSYEGEEIHSLRFTVKDDSAELGAEAISIWMQEAFDAIMDHSSDEYLDYIDVESWAKMYLFHELVKNYDVVNGSILMHRDGISADDKLIAGPIWDLDNALGKTTWNERLNMDVVEASTADKSYIESIRLDGNRISWLQELGKHESFKEVVKTIYAEYKDDINNMTVAIDEQVESLGTSIDMNINRFGIGELSIDNFNLDENVDFSSCEYPFVMVKTEKYEDYVANLKAYVGARSLFLEDYYGR